MAKQVLSWRAFWTAVSDYLNAATVFATTLTPSGTATAEQAASDPALLLQDVRTALLAQLSSRKGYGSGVFGLSTDAIRLCLESAEQSFARLHNSQLLNPAAEFARAGEEGGRAVASPASAAHARSDELSDKDAAAILKQCESLKPIGGGAFSSVYRVAVDGRLRAVKLIEIEEKNEASIRAEVRVLRMLHFDRCVAFRGAYTKPPKAIILTEYLGHTRSL